MSINPHTSELIVGAVAVGATGLLLGLGCISTSKCVTSVIAYNKATDKPVNGAPSKDELLSPVVGYGVGAGVYVIAAFVIFIMFMRASYMIHKHHAGTGGPSRFLNMGVQGGRKAAPAPATYMKPPQARGNVSTTGFTYY
jgi:hypothetical protein